MTPHTPEPDSPPGPEELRAIAREVAEAYAPLPDRESELVLMEVDPFRLHAYWNVREPDLMAALREAGSPYAPVALRLTDVTDDGEAFGAFDVEVRERKGRRYLDLPRDGRTCVAEFGVRRADGTLIRLLRSNEVATPVCGQAPPPRPESIPVNAVDVPDTAEEGGFPMPDWPLVSVAAEAGDLPVPGTENGAPVVVLPGAGQESAVVVEPGWIAPAGALPPRERPAGPGRWRSGGP